MNGSSFEQTWVLITQGYFVPYLVEIGRVVLEKIFKFSLFPNYIPFGKGPGPFKFPSPKDAVWQVWLKLAKWFWRRRFLNFVNAFSLFHNDLPLEEGLILLLKKLKFPLCQVWLKLVHWFWRRWWKCEKFMTMTNKLWSEKLTWTFGSGELNSSILNANYYVAGKVLKSMTYMYFPNIYIY